MKKSSLQNIKNNNRALILSCLSGGLNTRADIVKQSGLSKAAVTLIINDFLAEGRVVEKGADTDHSVGRPAITLELASDFCYAIGFYLTRNSISACITDHRSNTVDAITLPIDRFKTAREILDRLWQEVLLMAKKHDIPESKFIGIGVVAPGPLDYANGVIHNPPDFPLFQHFNIKEYLRNKTTLPIYLDKASALYAIADASKRKHKFKNAVYVIVSEGIGSSVLYKDQLFRGFGGYSGELGHTTVDPNGPLCSCGNRGCLERVISPAYIKEKFGFDKPYPQLVDLCYDRDEAALEILEYIADNLALALSNVISFIDPDAIVFCGQYNYRHELLLSMIKDKLNDLSMVARIHPVEVVTSLITEKDSISFSTAAIMKAYIEQSL